MNDTTIKFPREKVPVFIAFTQFGVEFIKTKLGLEHARKIANKKFGPCVVDIYTETKK